MRFLVTNILQLFIILLLLVSPYFIFNGKLFLGGDDMRLYYSYPERFITESSFFSWNTVSSLGYYDPHPERLPLLFIWSSLVLLFHSRIIPAYLAFSLPSIIGFIFMRKIIVELLGKEFRYESYIVALFYILSPILLINQISVFLTSVFLVALIPVIFYYYLKYLKTEKIRYIGYCIIFTFIFSPAMREVPWIAGTVLPLLLSLVLFSGSYNRKKRKNFIKKSIFFFVGIAVTQLYWLIPFVATFFSHDSGSTGSIVLSSDVARTFATTVRASAIGNVWYPLLNLFHREIVVEYNWTFLPLYLNYYDKDVVISSFYPLLLLLAIFFALKNKIKHILFYFIFTSFSLSLFFFTVNIGFLKEIFLFMGFIPGVAMFRNFYDKFALGYVFIFSLTIGVCLAIIKENVTIRIYTFILLILCSVIVINAFPYKQIVNNPIWTTKTTYEAIDIPKEYIDFTSHVKNTIQPTSYVLALPFTIAAYTTIKDTNTNNVFLGTSPFRNFTGISDISGEYSFLGKESKEFMDLVGKKDYKNINEFLRRNNINYIFLTKNIPKEVMNSYIFNKKVISAMDEDFKGHILGKRIITSSKGNYELYTTKYHQSIISGAELTYQRINPIEYKIQIKNITENSKLSFLERYNSQWKIFLQPFSSNALCDQYKRYDTITECKSILSINPQYDMQLNSFPQLPEVLHTNSNNKNTWSIDSSYIKKNFPSTFYKQNKNGSIDLELTLYFLPQNIFYISTILSIVISSIYFIFLSKITYVKKKL